MVSNLSARRDVPLSIAAIDDLHFHDLRHEGTGRFFENLPPSAARR